MPSHEEKVKDKHGQSESVVILVPLKRAKRAVLKVWLCVSWNTYFTKRTRNHIYYSSKSFLLLDYRPIWRQSAPNIGGGRSTHPTVRAFGPWCRQGSTVEFTNAPLFF
jgi:hypothetical protein